ncbi:MULTISPECIES: LysR family transcriptional regulator [unclassified Staphylococcus]|uniref:cidABC operon transcriptional activator CidR n=1 Tax=unclassified Staphylococcus TaxID=91994 RepID=UPI0021D0FF7F|nr:MULTISPECIES: LysR family transcriptional regulator [unclassified Staphylococcus]UXR71509.1 LysR family transcriptional regulator [Staphylococcus sp. IVB6240]UXR76106.1 LysR family transcriptional regulator [Staphylococcus sp. IVB6233]UXR80303.1 LysR family transcriptional regulator [Staphylococcus sp. IVB6218]
MDIKQMTYFVEVVKQGGMTRAAETLYIAQPTISKAIKELEAELGEPLFDRTKRQLSLTDVGHVFFDKASEILLLYENLPNAIQSVLGIKTGHISIALSAIMDMPRFTEVLGLFHQKYPNVTFSLVENGGKTIEAKVFNGDISLGVTSLPVDSTRFDAFPLYAEQFEVVVHRSHHLAQRESVTLSDLRNEDFILFNEDFYLNDRIIAATRKSGFVPNIVSRISQWHFIEHLLTAKMGISILPETICRIIRQNEDVRVIQLQDETLHWEMGVIWKKDTPLNHAAKMFLDYLNIHLPLIEAAHKDDV